MEDDDDAVGYKRPPKSKQYKPGQSGNPSGRKKKSRTSRMTLRLSYVNPLLFTRTDVRAGSPSNKRLSKRLWHQRSKGISAP